LRLTGDIVLATLAMALCWGSLLATYDLPAAVRLTSLRPTLEPRPLARLVWVALPLGCVAGIASLAVNVPRYVIEGDLGATALGHFTALSYLFVAAIQPMLALGMAVNPRLGCHFVTDLGAYRRLTWQTMLIAGGLRLLGIAAWARGLRAGSSRRASHTDDRRNHRLLGERQVDSPERDPAPVCRARRAGCHRRGCRATRVPERDPPPPDAPEPRARPPGRGGDDHRSEERRVGKEG